MCALGVSAAARFDGNELSSLCVEPGGDLLAVGDSSFRIARGTPDPLRGTTRSQSLRELVEDLGADPEKGSQWEGIATDGAGNVFVLQEHAGRHRPSHLFAFTPELAALVAVIELHVPEGNAPWRQDWRSDPNARAEAVVLLRDGHLLVVKQKNPIRLIEFGPSGDTPRGLGPGGLAGPGTGERFLTDDAFERRYEPLSVWNIDWGREPPLESVNDAAVAQGQLYLISRSSRRIARLRASRRPFEETLSVADSWDLPETIERPEGLVMLEALVPVVADDQPKQRRRDNVFRLEPLAARDDG